jgi:hypothetical protein
MSPVPREFAIESVAISGVRPLAVRRAAPIRYLEGVYLQARLGVLLSQHARRSDVVISERNGRYLVLSAETDAPGALAMSNRVAQAVHSQLGTTVAVGIASFPDDGQSFRDLLTVASGRCSSSFESTTPPAAAPVVE